VSPDVLGQRVDDQTRANVCWLEQPRRRHRVVDDIQDSARAAQVADALQIRHLRAWIGDRLDEHDAGRRRQRGLDVAHVGGVDERHRMAVRLERQECAGRVAEHESAGHDVVPALQEREHHRPDRRHSGGKADGAGAAFHCGDFRFERVRRRVALPAVHEAAGAALEHRRQVARVAVTVRDRHMQRLMQRAMLDRRVAVGMQDCRREAAESLVVAHRFTMMFSSQFPP